MALKAGWLAVRSAAQIDPMADGAVLVWKAVIRFMEDAPQIDRVAVCPAVGARPDLTVARGAGGFAVGPPQKIRPVTLRADAQGLAGIGPVEHPVQADRMDVGKLAAAGIGPKGSVTGGAGRFGVRSALKRGAVTGRTIVAGFAVAVGVLVAAEVNGMVKMRRRRSAAPRAHRILRNRAGQDQNDGRPDQGQPASDLCFAVHAEPPPFDFLYFP